jgi:hypothetical protein
VAALAAVTDAGGDEALDELEACQASVGLTAVAAGAVQHRSEAAQAALKLLSLLDARAADAAPTAESDVAESAAGRGEAPSHKSAAPPLAPLRPRQFAPRMQDGAAAPAGSARLAPQLPDVLSHWDEAAEAAVRNDAARREEDHSRALQRRADAERAVAEAQAREAAIAAEERQLRQAATYAHGMHQRIAAATADAVATLHAARAADALAAQVALLEARAESSGAKAAAAAHAARAAAVRLAPVEAALEDARVELQLRLLDAEQYSVIPVQQTKKPDGPQRIYRRR